MYVLSIRFCTDGDFGCSFKHPLFKYDGDYDYTMDVYWRDKDEAYTAAIALLKEIKDCVHSSRDYMLKYVHSMFDVVIAGLELGVTDICDEVGGNQDGTYISFREVESIELERNEYTEVFTAMQKLKQICSQMPKEQCGESCPFSKLCKPLNWGTSTGVMPESFDIAGGKE